MSHIKQIAVQNLTVGMYISDQSEGVADGKILDKGFIKREETIKKIQSKGLTHVWIDVDLGEDSEFAVPLLKDGPSSSPRTSLDDEMEKAQKVYGEARGLIDDIMMNVKMGRAIDVAPVEDLADDINNSVLNNPNALQCLSQIREKDKYLLEHSVNVGILMSIFATYMGFDKKLVKELTTGALLHDIGKIRVPSKILNKPGKLTEDEWIEMRLHVVYGQAVLNQSEGISNVAKSICALHHERLDGEGYPIGFKEHQIDLYGRMAAVVDIYDAITATRCYHEGKSPFEAMKILSTLGGTHLDKSLVYSFIRCLSVYPVGTLLELGNGKVGVVIEVTPRLPNKPIIRIFYNKKHKRYESPSVVNLAKSDHKVVATWHAEELGVQVGDFL